jgi:hypothetical protein
MLNESSVSKEPNLITTPERFLEKARRYEALLRSVQVPGWRLAEVSKNFRKGASVYGLFHYEGGGKRPVRDVKVRLSEHVGRWSGFDLDLRDPKEKDLESLVRCLRSRSL